MGEMANNTQYSGVQMPHQPPMVGPMDTPRGFVPPMSHQFRPVVPPPQSQQFIPVASQHFQPVGRGATGLPSQTQQPQFPQLMQQLPARPGPPPPNHVPPPPNHVPPPLNHVLPPPSHVLPLQRHVLPPQQAVSLPNAQQSNHIPAGSILPPSHVQAPNTYPPGLGGHGAPFSASYTFAPSSYAQPQIPVNAGTQYLPMSQVHVPSIPAGGQLGASVSQTSVSVTPPQHSHEQPAVTITTVKAASVQPKPAVRTLTDWIEHTSADGRRYYFNRRTRLSTWDKPLELMTPVERTDATTDWKEFTSLDGRTYYYNKVTKQSVWTIPDELKLAREQAEKASIQGMQSEPVDSQTSVSAPSVAKAPCSTDTPTSTVHGVASSPVAVVPVVAAGNIQPALDSTTSTSPVVASSFIDNADEIQTTVDAITPVMAFSGTAGDNATVITDEETMNNSSNLSAHDVISLADEVPAQNTKETRKDVMIGEKINDASEEKTVEQEHLTYANKLEAKNAFKALLESANIGSDWTWDQAMRVIIVDKRYGTLRTLGERKQAFNEFLGQKKKEEAEERRNKLKKAREDYKKMLEESTELTSTSRWSKALTMFENDDRFKAVERERDRRDLFDNHLEELKQKERAKALEEHKRYVIEYRQFLESCDFIKANSQWRKVQDRLEADERCLRLDKMDRLEIFQEYLRDLEKEEEEQRKIQKEELRKAERKNRDEFRKLMEEDVAAGTLTAKTHWRDYCMKVKDLPAYVLVASNTSGSTPKDLFEDVADELQKQYQEDKTRIKDTVKLKRITLSSTSIFEDFKTSILEDVTSQPPISDVRIKLIFYELVERAKEKEEKEAKKRKRLTDEFSDLLHSIKDISASSTWENCKKHFECSREFSSIGEESIRRGIFDEYITQLKEQTKENERKRKEEKAKKEKEREERDRTRMNHGREKDRGREREKEDHLKKDAADIELVETTEIYVSGENRRSGKDRDKKNRKRHQGSQDNLNETEKDRSKNSHRHSSDRKKSRRHGSTPESENGSRHKRHIESENDSRHKRHKRDHRNGSRKSGDHGDLEDGEM